MAGPAAKGDKSHFTTSDGTIICKGGGSSCGVVDFLSAANLYKAHDERLAELTRRLNALIDEYRPHVPKGLELRYVRVPGEGLFLAYARCEDDGGPNEGDPVPEEDAAGIKQALSIR
jgi:hypothetical protein